MAGYKRKYGGRGRRGKRKMRRTMNNSRPKRVYNNVNTSKVLIKRTFWAFNWTPNTTTTAGFYRYLSTSLAAMPSYLEITNLFDQYKIARIKVTLRPRYDSFSGENTTDTTLPGVTNQGGTMVHTIIDPTSKFALSGSYGSGFLNTVLENGSVRSYQGNRPINLFFKPYVNNTIGGVAAQRIPCPYIDCDQPNIGLNGVHVYLQDVNNTGTFGQSFDVFYTFYMVARGLQ